VTNCTKNVNASPGFAIVLPYGTFKMNGDFVSNGF
jgi:hypothetical protein